MEVIYGREIALLARRAAAAPDKPTLRRLVADGHWRYAEFFKSCRLAEPARKALHNHRDIVEKLAAEFPREPLYRHDVIASHGSLAALLEGAGRVKDAEKVHDQTVLLAERLFKDFPGPTQRDLLATWCSEGGHYYSRQGEPRKAVAAEGKVLELLPDNVYARFNIPANLLLAGDRDGYRRSCAEAWKRFGDGKDRFAVYMVARACALAPDAVADPAALVKAMARVVTAEPTHWHLFVLGLAHHRAGQWDQAISRFEESIKAKPTWLEWTAQNGLGLALAHHRRGDRARARQWLARSVDLLEQGTRDKGLYVSFPAHFPDWVTCRILRAEAEALIGKSAPKTDANK
jgi:tetratricopeptide (TPR) repeat protein